MTPIRIYADFNGVVRGVRDVTRSAVVLDTFGTARDLANAGVALSVGLPLIVVDASDESEDLEGHGVAEYDRERQRWIVEFDAIGIRYVPAGDRTPVRRFLCHSCRTDIGPSLDTSGKAPSRLHANARGVPLCPICGTSIDAAILPPPGMPAQRSR